MINVGGRSLGKQLNLYVLNIPRCTDGIPHTRHGIPQRTHGDPQCTETPSVLNTARCTHDIPSVLNTPGVLNDIPQCTEHPPVYCTDNMQGESVVC